MEDISENVQEDDVSVDAADLINNTIKEDETVAETNKAATEETYNTQYLIDNCKALGYKKEVVAGALFNCEKTEMTKTEFISLIENFLGKEVK